MRLTAQITAHILGSGSSGGVPRVGNHWGACDPQNPKNRRRRCSLLLHQDGPEGRSTLLIDTAPELKDQLNDAACHRVDGVLFTHEHADQAHGIDDLRQLALIARARVNVWASPACLSVLTRRFDYCFKMEAVSDYPPILNAHVFDGPFAVAGAGGPVRVTPISVAHGHLTAHGFRIGGLAYIPDVSDLDDAAFDALTGLDLLIVDALRYTPHPSHAHVEKTLGWIARAKPARAVLTNLHVDLDYATLASQLPPGIEPAFDGMVLQVGG